MGWCTKCLYSLKDCALRCSRCKLETEVTVTGQKATIDQLTTMLAISKNVPFPGHNHLLTTGTDDPSLAGTRAIIKVSGHQHQRLAIGYDLEIGHF